MSEMKIVIEEGVVGVTASRAFERPIQSGGKPRALHNLAEIRQRNKF